MADCHRRRNRLAGAALGCRIAPWSFTGLGRREWQFVIRAVWGVVFRGLGLATPGRLARLAVAGGVCLLQGSDGWAERPMPAAGGRRSQRGPDEGVFHTDVPLAATLNLGSPVSGSSSSVLSRVAEWTKPRPSSVCRISGSGSPYPSGMLPRACRLAAGPCSGQPPHVLRLCSPHPLATVGVH